MDIHNKNRRREYSHLSQFMKKCESFPLGDCRFDDKPDLLVDINGHILGVEHTQLFISSTSPNPSAAPQAQEELQDRVVEQARAIHESCGRPMLWLYVNFNHNFILTKRATQEAASALADTLAMILTLFPKEQVADAWNDSDRLPYAQRKIHSLPEGINGIHFKYVNDPGFVLWGVPRSGMVPKLSPEQIQGEIIKKETKLKDYRSRCNEIWLLMVAEAFSPASHYELSDAISRHIFESRFDRIFFLNTASDKVVELKVELPSSDQLSR